MALFRCEAIFDMASGKYYVEMFYPENSAEPIGRTPAVYPSAEMAEIEAVKMFQKWMESEKN